MSEKGFDKDEMAQFAQAFMTSLKEGLSVYPNANTRDAIREVAAAMLRACKKIDVEVKWK